MTVLLPSGNLIHQTSKFWHCTLGKWFQAAEVSADYRAWRHQFLLKRLQIGLWIAFPSYLLITINNFYLAFSSPEQLIEQNQVYGVYQTVETLQLERITLSSAIFALLLACQMLLRTRWGQKYPTFLLVMLALVLNDFVPQLIGISFGSFNDPDKLVFLAVALIIPVYWRLHLLAQLAPVAFYLLGYPFFNLVLGTQFNIYGVSGIRDIIDLCWVCVSSILAVYWYERLKQSEFETQRQLQVFLYSVSHDLQTPAMGTSMLLKSVLNDPQDYITVHRSILEGLQEGSDRQSVLIESLLDAHRSDLQVTQLRHQPFHISTLVESILLSFKPLFTHHEVKLHNKIYDDLPLVKGDEDQLWRVFSNLITNALKHNPNHIELTLDAEVLYAQKMLRCTVKDNGIGIPPQQRQRLFERYARGARARYMPGLGLGLYICRRIVQAHGGEIDVISHPGSGTAFRFTLPLA